MPPLRLLAGTQYFTGLQLPSLQSPMGWEIVWRNEGRAFPLGGQGGYKVRRREPVKIGKWEQRMKFRGEASAGEESVFFGLGNYILKELSTHRNSLQRWLAVDSRCLSGPCLIKSLSGPCCCMDKQSDAQGTVFAPLFLLSWPHRWPLWAQRCARGCKEGAFLLQEGRRYAPWPALPSLPWQCRGRQGSWRGFLLASQSIISQCLLFIPLAKPSPHPCHCGDGNFSDL